MEITTEQLNEEFCRTCGIKKSICYLRNLDTGEIRYYSHISGLYRTPVGWKEVDGAQFADEPIYPDLINNPKNFCALLNIQWNLFGELGQAYKKVTDESFQINYLKTRLLAIKMCKSFGGGEMLNEYLKQVKETKFDYVEDFVNVQELMEDYDVNNG